MALDNTLNFMGYRKIAQIASAILLVISIASLSTNGLKLGLDFTGGTLVEVAYDQTADLGNIR